MPDKTFIGWDIGGSLQRGRVEDEYGNVLAENRWVTQEYETNPETFQLLIYERTKTLRSLAQTSIDALGICVPGPVNEKFEVVQLPNFKHWGSEPVPLKANLERVLGIPVGIDNDANVAALAVYAKEAQVPSLLYVTVSTGIGGGWVLNGKIHRGTHGDGLEVGHMKLSLEEPAIQCGCGDYNCLETFASGTAIAQEGKLAALRSKTFLAYLSSHKLEVDDITAKVVCEAALGDIAVTWDIIENAANALGVGLVNILNVINPSAVYLGGGVMNSASLFLPIVEEVVKARAMGSNKSVPIHVSQTQDRGIIGAIMLAKQAHADS